LIANGGSLTKVSGLLGHASPQVTAEKYAHEFEKSQRMEETRERIATMYDSGTRNSSLVALAS
jgi:hypothetical protein